MPGEASDKGADIALDAMTGRAAQSARTTYLALLTAAPTDGTTLATMTEVTTAGTNGYTRQAVTWSAPAAGSGGTAGQRVTSNTGAITFGPFTSDLGNVTHAALVSAATGTTGDLIYFWTLDSARDPAVNDTISVAVGALVMAGD